MSPPPTRLYICMNRSKPPHSSKRRHLSPSLLPLSSPYSPLTTPSAAMRTPIAVLICVILVSTVVHNVAASPAPATLSGNARTKPDNETIYNISKHLCWGCVAESLQFLYAHNLVRAAHWELPLIWDFNLQKYAQWWANQRRGDCKLEHSFPEDDFKLGENVFWGGGSAWNPSDAVDAWAGEEKYYSYSTNTCQPDQMCGHYTQIVWKTTRRMGCARVVCDNGDVFITCNYDPPGNYFGEKPY